MNLNQMGPYQLGETNDPLAIEMLIQYLIKGNHCEKRLAASAIGKLSKSFLNESKKAIPFLIDALKDSSPQVRQYCLKALEKLDVSANFKEELVHIVTSDEKLYNVEIAARILSKQGFQFKRRSTTKEKQHFTRGYTNPLGEDLFDFKETFYQVIINSPVSEIEKRIILLRLGYVDGRYYTVDRIAKDLNLSKEKVHPIYRNTLNRIATFIKNSSKGAHTQLETNQLNVILQRLVNKSDYITVLNLSNFIFIHLSDLPINIAVYLLCSLLQKRKLYSIVEDKLLNISSSSDNSILNQISWPSGRVSQPSRYLFPPIPSRKVNFNNASGTTGEFLSNKNSCKIMYESHLELGFIELLEKHTDIISFAEQPGPIRYIDNDKVRQYTPDFICQFADGSCFIVEMKSVKRMVTVDNLKKFRALHLYCKQNRLGYLITDGKFSFEDIRKKKTNKEFEKRISNALESKPMIGLLEFNKIFQETRATNFDLVNAILGLKLKLSYTPFTLKK